MKRRTVKLCIPEDVYATIEDTARRIGQTSADVANEMLVEAARMRRVPGIVFADGTSGRVARVGGTGLDVWEIIEQYRAVDESWEQLKAGFDWLSEHQLRAALAYATAYPEEIEEALRENASWTPEKTWAAYPFMKP
jgi:uncharacterized protein (DUF433 family)